MFGPYVIEPARAEEDEFIVDLARENGLHVDSKEERERPQARLLVARASQGTPVVLGFILGWVVSDEVELLDVCVATEARRKGVGVALVLDLFRRATLQGATSAFLEVRASNAAGIALYERLGFVPCGVRARYYADGEDARLFRCCIGPSP